MSDLISRAMVKAEIMDWARVITNPKMLSTEDTMHILDSMEGATDEEFKAEAKRRGYNVIKIPEPVKLLPCVCGKGRRKVEQWVNAYGRYYKCDNCGLESFVGRSERKAKLLWNAMIEREIRDAEKEND